MLLLSIESFGAVVSDNDGSAFITKAEFDSLKINFQSQIDQYNTSIDSKIDGAIASYLAGIMVSKKENVDLVDWWNEARFMDDIMMYSKQVTYTSSSDKTVSTLRWHRPNTGNRIEIESSTLAIASQIGEEYGPGIAWRVGGNIPSKAGTGVQNAKSGIGGWQPNVDRYALAPTLLFLWKDGNGDWVFNSTEPGLRSGKHVNTWSISTHKLIASSRNLWELGYSNVNVTPDNNSGAFQILAPASGKLINFKIWFHTGSTQDWVQDSPDTQYIIMPYRFGPLPISCPQTNIDMTSLNTTELRTMDMYNSTDDQTKEGNNFIYLMLGRSQTWKVLTAHRLGISAVGTQTKDNSDSKKSNITYNVTNRFMTYIFSLNSTNTLSTGTHSGTIAFPLWDEDTVNELKNGRFYYKDRAIKIGQGIPLGNNPISGSGKADIKIMFEKKNVQTGADATDKKVGVKIKKNDFLSSGEYATGKVGKSETTVTFNDSFWMDAGYEYDLEVDMKKGEQIWLQLSPAGGAADIYTGNYARLTKLTVEYEIE